jgi:hypothetical protein
MRDIYVRHRPRCRYAQADYKDAKKRPSRQIFGCGCPIYARVEIRDNTTKDLLFEHNGSLKGVTAKEAAEELVNTWFVKYLSGETPAIGEQKAAVTIQKAIDAYLDEKKGSFPVSSVNASVDMYRTHFPTLPEIARDTDHGRICGERTTRVPVVSGRGTDGCGG